MASLGSPAQLASTLPSILPLWGFFSGVCNAVTQHKPLSVLATARFLTKSTPSQKNVQTDISHAEGARVGGPTFLISTLPP